MSTVKTHNGHKKMIEVLKKIKQESSNNDMLATAIQIAKLHTEFELKPEKIESELKKINCQISLPHVYNHIKLAGVPAKVKSQIKAGKIKATDVLGLMHKHQEPKELIDLVDKAIVQREKELQEKRLRMSQKKEAEKSKTLIEKISRAFENVTGKKPDSSDINDMIRKMAV